MKHFDTLEKYEEYLAAGMSDKQARVHVKSLTETYEMSRDDLATKLDLDLVESRLESKIHQVEAKIDQVELRLESKIDKLGNTVYLMGGAIFTVCCIPILQKFFQ